MGRILSVAKGGREIQAKLFLRLRGAGEREKGRKGVVV